MAINAALNTPFYLSLDMLIVYKFHFLSWDFFKDIAASYTFKFPKDHCGMDHGVIECYLYERPKLGVVEHTCNPS
jgi:hypothetical protein